MMSGYGEWDKRDGRRIFRRRGVEGLVVVYPPSSVSSWTDDIRSYEKTERPILTGKEKHKEVS